MDATQEAGTQTPISETEMKQSPPFLVREHESETPVQIPTGQRVRGMKMPRGIADRFGPQERQVIDEPENATAKIDFKPEVGTIIEILTEGADPVYLKAKEPWMKIEMLPEEKRKAAQERKDTSVYVERLVGPPERVQALVDKARSKEGGLVSAVGTRHQTSPDHAEVWVTKP